MKPIPIEPIKIDWDDFNLIKELLHYEVSRVVAAIRGEDEPEMPDFEALCEGVEEEEEDVSDSDAWMFPAKAVDIK